MHSPPVYPSIIRTSGRNCTPISDYSSYSNLEFYPSIWLRKNIRVWCSLYLTSFGDNDDDDDDSLRLRSRARPEMKENLQLYRCACRSFPAESPPPLPRQLNKMKTAGKELLFTFPFVCSLAFSIGRALIIFTWILSCCLFSLAPTHTRPTVAIGPSPLLPLIVASLKGKGGEPANVQQEAGVWLRATSIPFVCLG